MVTAASAIITPFDVINHNVAWLRPQLQLNISHENDKKFIFKNQKTVSTRDPRKKVANARRESVGVREVKRAEDSLNAWGTSRERLKEWRTGDELVIGLMLGYSLIVINDDDDGALWWWWWWWCNVEVWFALTCHPHHHHHHHHHLLLDILPSVCTWRLSFSLLSVVHSNVLQCDGLANCCSSYSCRYCSVLIVCTSQPAD